MYILYHCRKKNVYLYVIISKLSCVQMYLIVLIKIVFGKKDPSSNNLKKDLYGNYTLYPYTSSFTPTKYEKCQFYPLFNFGFTPTK